MKTLEVRVDCMVDDNASFEDVADTVIGCLMSADGCQHLETMNFEPVKLANVRLSKDQIEQPIKPSTPPKDAKLITPTRYGEDELAKLLDDHKEDLSKGLRIKFENGKLVCVPHTPLCGKADK